jgi:hypothetical protein
MNEHDGWSSCTYNIPEGAVDVDDLITMLQINWHMANILKATWRYGKKCMPGKSFIEAKRYDLRKIIWMAQRELAALDKQEVPKLNNKAVHYKNDEYLFQGEEWRGPDTDVEHKTLSV